ncbi:MAG TPA: inositol monophosphatase family protein, partial [Methylomirabilota bacterium]|nr:inositol monophosphatase family protein [Methylomirabilota bacterium]
FLAAGKPALGVIYHAATDSLYAACAGRGATRNGAVMAASARTSLDDATLAFETSLNAELGVHRGAVDGVAARGGEYRRYGSAALSLALVADGKLDGFIEARLSAWDVAAGIVLVTEAGGWTNDFFAGDGLRRGNAMLAAAPGLREEVHALWAAAVAGDAQSPAA